jgi:hypothetical protein
MGSRDPVVADGVTEVIQEAKEAANKGQRKARKLQRHLRFLLDGAQRGERRSLFQVRSKLTQSHGNGGPAGIPGYLRGGTGQDWRPRASLRGEWPPRAAAMADKDIQPE